MAAALQRLRDALELQQFIQDAEDVSSFESHYKLHSLHKKLKFVACWHRILYTILSFPVCLAGSLAFLLRLKRDGVNSLRHVKSFKFKFLNYFYMRSD